MEVGGERACVTEDIYKKRPVKYPHVACKGLDSTVERSHE